MKVHSNRHEYAIYCHSEWGPSFGPDIIINNNANTIKTFDFVVL